jgi:hypothetical protein
LGERKSKGIKQDSQESVIDVIIKIPVSGIEKY